MENQREIYLVEANELLGELETALLELESTPDDAELIGRVFRALHTIKGSGAMFGFDAVAEFTHDVETTFDRVREGELAVSKELINIALSAKDQISAIIESCDNGETIDSEVSEQILSELARLVSEQTTVSAGRVDSFTPDFREAGEAPSGEEVTYWIRFKPEKEVFASGTNPILLLSELRELGECHVLAQTDSIPQLDAIDPEGCYTRWDIVLTTDKGMNPIKDVFIFVEDECELKISVVESSYHEGAEESNGREWKRLGEILVERGDLTPEQLEEALGMRERFGEMLVARKLVTPGAVESALAVQKHVRQARSRRQECAHLSSIRVDADKLDSLVDLVGELVTVQARLSRKADDQKDPELILIAEEVERLTSELRDNTMGIRMLPIGTTFARFTRLVRDLSDSLGKEVTMTTDGGDTELDKTVIEQLGDPLVHIIRNSIDHGIEMPDQRKAAGKPRQGIVHLEAVHSGADVLIRISDDGAGLDPEAIRAKALEKGLVAPDAVLSEKEIFSLIFMPGFSTAACISDVSGRGVGMDVVRSAIDALRGSIEVDSRLNAGTTITLKLPLTLAIIDGLAVRIGDTDYVMPLHAVEECLELSRGEADRAHARNMMPFRGKVLSYLSLRDQFQAGGQSPEMEQVVVVEAAGEKVGLGVDRVIGQYQTVIKSLGKLYRDVEGFSGATVMGDGTVALILDIPHLVSAAESRKEAVA